MSNGSIWPIDRSLLSSTTQPQKGQGAMTIKGTLHSPKLQHYENLYLSLSPTRQDLTRRSIKVGIMGGGGRARAEARILLNYGAARPPEGGQADTRSLMASSLLLSDCTRTSGWTHVGRESYPSEPLPTGLFLVVWQFHYL